VDAPILVRNIDPRCPEHSRGNPASQSQGANAPQWRQARPAASEGPIMGPTVIRRGNAAVTR